VTTHVVIYAADASLNQAPETFDGVRMNVVSSHVNLFAVIDPMMFIAANSQSIVGCELIREQPRSSA